MITTVALLGSLVGAWLNAEHKISGFYVWIIANMLWLTDSWFRNDIQQSILWIYYSLVCIMGMITWRSKKC